MDIYHTELVWKIDLILVGITLLLVLANIASITIHQIQIKRRERNLASIIAAMENLADTGKTDGQNISLSLAKSFTQDIFLESLKQTTQTPEMKERLGNYLANHGKIAEIEKNARSSRNKYRRIEALLIAGYLKTPAAPEILRQALLDSDQDISYFAMLSLGYLKNKTAAQILLDFLDRHVFSGHKIISILETFPPDIVDELAGALKNSDPLVRFWTVKLITRFKPARLAERIIDLTGDISLDVRAAACECLGELGQSVAGDTIRRCLKDSEWVVRMHAVRALPKIIGRESVPFISSLINDSSLLVRRSVKGVMTQYIETALPYIETLLQGNDETAKKDCIEILENSGYLNVLFQNILSVPASEHPKTLVLLEGLIKSGAHSGLESALAKYPDDARKKILDVIANINKTAADHIEKKINRLIEEL